MRALRLLGALALALAVQLGGTAILPSFPVVFDVLLVVLVAQALRGDTTWALACALVVGMLHDTLHGRAYGLFGAADAIVAYATAVTAQRVVIQRVAGQLIAFFTAAVAHQAALLGISLLMVREAGLPAFGWILVKAATTALLGAAAHIAAGSVRRRYEIWSRQRVARLGFGRRRRA